MKVIRKTSITKNILRHIGLLAVLTVVQICFLSPALLLAEDFEVVVDQSTGGGNWNYLGRFNLDVGTESYVSLSPDSDDASCAYNAGIVADAVVFVPVSSTGDYILIDNSAGAQQGDGEFQQTGTFTHEWGYDYDGNQAWPDWSSYYYTLYSYHWSEDEGSEARWIPEIVSADEYDIYAYWYVRSAYGWCSDPTAKYIVHTSDSISITASAGEDGTISPEGQVFIEEGEDQSFTIVPDTDFNVNTITIDDVEYDLDLCTIGGDPCDRNGDNFTYTFYGVNEDHTIDVEFYKVLFTITPTVEGVGTIDPGDVQEDIARGDDFVFNINSPDGNPLIALYIDDVEIDIETLSQDVDDSYIYTFENVVDDHTIHAIFDDHSNERAGATNLGCGESTTGWINPEEDVDYFEINLDTNARVVIQTTDSGSDTVDTFGKLMNADGSLILSSGIGGSGTHFQLDSGTEEPLNAGQYFVEVSTESVTDTGQYTIELTCTSYYTIDPSSSSGGSIDPSNEVDVVEGGSQTFTMDAFEGGEIEKITIDGIDEEDSEGNLLCAGETTCSYTFENIDQNHTIHVSYLTNLSTCIDISETPMDVFVNAAPANVMFVLDDSGSMDWTTLVGAGINGDGVFDNMLYMFDLITDSSPDSIRGDNLFTTFSILSNARRLKWKSQFAEVNKMYFNPGTEYTPWPSYEDTGDGFFDDADIDSPPSHPLKTQHYINNNDTYFATNPIFGDVAATPINDDVVDANIVIDENDYYAIEVNQAGTLVVTTSTTGVTCYGNDTIGMLYDSNGNTIGYNDNCTEYSPSECGCNTTGFYIEAEVEPGTYYISVGINEAPFLLYYADDYLEDYFQTPYSLQVGLFDGTRDISYGLSTPSDTQPSGDGIFGIANSHYYTWDDANSNETFDNDEDVYLVEMVSGTVNYYKLDESVGMRDDYIEVGELQIQEVGDLPSTLLTVADPSSANAYLEERQNFSNWFTYYRRRMHTSKKAVGEMVSQIEKVNIGINAINDKLIMAATYVENSRSTILQNLYNLDAEGGTALRQTVYEVGRYYHQYDGISLTGESNDDDCPYDSADDGGECQQSFAIVMTDGYYNGGTDYIDVDVLANHDGDGDTEWDGDPYGDEYSATLADIAMYYYETDLSTSLENLVPTNVFDDNTAQHMVVYGVSFGVFGTLDPDDYDEDLKSKTSPFNEIVWTDPTSGNSQKIDDLYHASVNARGSFISAGDPEELVNSLLEIMRSIEARIGSAASVTVNGDDMFAQVSDGDIYVYQPAYDSTDWTGDIISKKLIVTNVGDEYDEDDADAYLGEEEWSASDEIELVLANENGWKSRVFVTYNPDEKAGIRFRLDESNSDQLNHFTSAQKTLLEDSVQAREYLVNYIRGDDSQEISAGGSLRSRGAVLGDFVDSAPVYNEGVVYAGANDGALHAFNATTGKELFAYIPNLVLENLQYLSDPLYDHKFYVNNTVAIGEVKDGGVYKDVLIGGLGRGGKGFYAIDIDEIDEDSSYAIPPTSEEGAKAVEDAIAAKILWEYPNSSTSAEEISDLGYSYSVPQIVGTSSTAYPYVALMGNGYNSETSKAKLLIIDVFTGALIKSIDTNPDAEFGDCNGLSTPAAIDIDYDDKVDYVYAGDLRGNMWKFDLSSSAIDDWAVSYVDESQPAALFTAKNDSAQRQPIIGQPDVTVHCDQDVFNIEYPGQMVMFATGKFLGETDIDDTSQQTVYGIWDYGDAEDEFLGEFNRVEDDPLSNQPGTRDNEVITLLEQEIIEPTGDYIDADFDYDGFWMVEEYDDDGNPTGEELHYRVLTEHEPNYLTEEDSDDDAAYNLGAWTCDDGEDNDDDGSTDADDASDECVAHAGWYFDLPLSGERVDQNVIIRDGKVIAVSFIPEEATCSSGGISVLHEFDACDGGSTDDPTFYLVENPTKTDNNYLTPPDGDPQVVSGVLIEGRVNNPVIVKLNDEVELKIFSSDQGIVTIREKPQKLGMNYWLEH